METPEYKTGPVSLIPVRPLLLVLAPFVFVSVLLHWPTVMQMSLHPSSPPTLVILAIGSLCLAGLSLFATRRDDHPRQNPWIIAGMVVIWAVIDQLFGAAMRALIDLQPVAPAEFAAALSGTLPAIVKWFATPYGGEAEQVRRRFRRHILHRALRDRRHIAAYVNDLARRTAWGMAGGIAVITLYCVYLNWAPQDISWIGYAQMLPTFVIGMVIVIAMTPIIALASNLSWLVGHAAAEYARPKPCFACGASCVDARFDSVGMGRCTRCKQRIHRGQWIAPPLLSKEQRKKLLNRSMFIWMPIMCVAQITASVSLMLMPMYFAIQFVTLGAFVLAMRKSYLKAVAKRFDRQHIECRECAYDLRGAPVDRGIGTCPECSTQFAQYGGPKGSTALAVAEATASDAEAER